MKYKTSYMKTKVIKIYYYKGNNFGDELGPYIVTQLSGLKTQYKEIVVSPLRMVLRIIKNIIHFRFYYLKQIKSISFDKKVLVPIGSTIARGNKKTTFWGNGFLNKKRVLKVERYMQLEENTQTKNLEKMALKDALFMEILLYYYP